MKVRVAGAVRTGRAMDLRRLFHSHAEDVGESRSEALSLRDVAREVRGDGGRDFDRDCTVGSDCGGEYDGALAIDCPDPGPVHDHVGVIRAEMDLSVRPALAAAARTRGHTAPQADELAAVRDRRDALDVPELDLERARRRVADANDATEEMRERVATLRGRVQALRDADADPTDAEADLAEATRRLSEVQTERIAAEQALTEARERARANRQRRRERLRLADRADNLRRAAREHLADEVRSAFADARDAVPDGDIGESVESALAVARVAAYDAPVVLARETDPFESAAEAAEWLDGPVIRL
ncbi:hypothetical protein [Halorussus sp. MSC15.2]|uniref:DUF7856 family protein n=1 Tax=Halorussus sp. MSC15.2 TaxID=2283638 RepID=UPI0013D3E508|nr:hypothetical protein [Halorussus sp. MSC15.2]NEU58414.1 hypothetical protein [Halorussus sp. MSC15.2]